MNEWMKKTFNSIKPTKLLDKTAFLHESYEKFSKYEAEPDLFDFESSCDSGDTPIDRPAPLRGGGEHRACFSVQWCTKCAVMNENVQWRKAVCAVMN